MPRTIRWGDHGPDVTTMKGLLSTHGFEVTESDACDAETVRAVRAFQYTHVDATGDPLKPDGVTGPLTWWGLTHAASEADPLGIVDFTVMPPTAGSSLAGMRALGRAIAELNAGAGEVGGNNTGPWVQKYLAPVGGSGAAPWCAAFVSWCYHDSGQLDVPFPYTLGARDMMNEFKTRKWMVDTKAGNKPAPGDVVFYWRGAPDGWQGHAGFVYQVAYGFLFTIEGNRTSLVQGFRQVYSRVDKLLGFGHVA